MANILKKPDTRLKLRSHIQGCKTAYQWFSGEPRTILDAKQIGRRIHDERIAVFGASGDNGGNEKRKIHGWY